jgi:hypothetical protein
MKDNNDLCLIALIFEALVLVAIGVFLTALATGHLPEGDPSLALLWITFLHPRSTTFFAFL